VHDKAIVDRENWHFPKGIKVHQDLGFQGHKPEGVQVSMPQRKPRGKELTEEQKAENKLKAAERVKVEHAIGGVKILRIVKDRIRLWKKDIKDLVMELACAIHNFKIAYST
jgi:hypothetical protein